MATAEQILNTEFESLRVDLIKEYDTLGMRASGDFAESLEVKTTKDNAKLIGNKYAEQLEYGRKSGKRPPIAAIKKWIEDKGIVNNIKGNISVSSLAFLIARKIGEQGWKREKHGGVDLISKVITEKRIQSIIDKVGNALALSFVSKLEKEFKELA